jgi:hypothetical protein
MLVDTSLQVGDLLLKRLVLLLQCLDLLPQCLNEVVQRQQSEHQSTHGSRGCLPIGG